MLLSYLPSRMLWLRVMACVADIGFIIAATLIGLSSPGMLPTAIFALLSLVINAFYIYKLSLIFLPVRVPKNALSIYRSLFSEISPMEFKILLRACQLREAENCPLVTRRRRTPLILLKSGQVDIRLGKQVVSTVSGGAAILGEISFLTDEPAIVDAYAKGRVEYFELDRERFENALSAYEETRLKIMAFLIRSLAEKLGRQNRSVLAQQDSDAVSHQQSTTLPTERLCKSV